MDDDTRRYTLLKPLRDQVSGGYRAVRDRLSILATLARRELRTGAAIDLPLRRRLWLWRRGFTSRSDALFDLSEENYRQFVSDLQHERADGLAGRWDAVVNNKLTYYLLFGSFSERLPDLYGVLDEGRFDRRSPLMPVAPGTADRLAVARGPAGTSDATARTDRDGSTLVEANAGGVEGDVTETADSVEGDAAGSVDAVGWIDDYLDANDRVVLKPIYGHGGRGVYVCRREADGTGGTSGTSGGDGATYDVNGTTTSRVEFASLIDGLEQYLAWEFVEQAPYADSLFPEATNTLRVMTLWDDERGEPFVSGAVHRIGTRASAPVDNWSRGGLSAELRSDGTLGPGAQWLPSEGRVHWFEDHPDTGARIQGTEVPDWAGVRESLLEMAAEFPYLPRLGWDVVLTGEGEFAVLEVNAHAATRTFQVHGPLLSDPRTRRFYERHGSL
jgi:hypothetical protein